MSASTWDERRRQLAEYARQQSWTSVRGEYWLSGRLIIDVENVAPFKYRVLMNGENEYYDSLHTLLERVAQEPHKLKSPGASLSALQVVGVIAVLAVFGFGLVLCYRAGSGPDPQEADVDPAAGKSLEYMLASLDNRPGDEELYRTQLDVLETKCVESRQGISDAAVGAQRYMRSKGIDESLRSILTSMTESIPAGAPELRCTDIAAAFVTLRIGNR